MGITNNCLKCGKDLTKQPQFNWSVSFCDKCAKQIEAEQTEGNWNESR